jgi:hypothetical protein
LSINFSDSTPVAPSDRTNVQWQGDGSGNVSANIPRPLTFQGAYSAGTTYALNDIATYSGSAYVSLQNSNLNQQPDSSPTYWEVLAQKGSSGGSLALTTKGDILGYDTASNRVPIGTNGELLIADSAQALGLKWGTPTLPESAITNLTSDLAAKAPLVSPALTGTPTAPTATGGTNTTQVATTAFVESRITTLINAAPSALDTLGEIATQLASDESAASALTTAVSLKAPLASPALTGTPTAPTPSAADNSTKLATTAYVDSAVSGVGTGTVTHTGGLTSDLPVLGNGSADIKIGTKTGTGDVVFSPRPRWSRLHWELHRR